jgi:hypothetical protein
VFQYKGSLHIVTFVYLLFSHQNLAPQYNLGCQIIFYSLDCFKPRSYWCWKHEWRTPFSFSCCLCRLSQVWGLGCVEEGGSHRPRRVWPWVLNIHADQLLALDLLQFIVPFFVPLSQALLFFFSSMLLKCSVNNMLAYLYYWRNISFHDTHF